MIYKYSPIIFILVIFFSCNKKSYKEIEVDGIRTLSNYEANDENFRIDIERKFAYKLKDIIPSNIDIINVDYTDVSDDGKIYILDSRQYKVHIIGADGNYINSFGNKGIGPFEFSGSLNMVVVENRVIITLVDQAKSLIFDGNGNPLEEKKFISTNDTPANVISSGDYIISYNSSMSYEPDTKNRYSINRILLFDNKLTNIAIISDEKELRESGKSKIYGKLGSAVCIDSNDRIYITKESFTKYEFDIFDIKMNKLETISKKARTIPYSKEDEMKVVNLYKNIGIDINFEFKNKQLIRNILLDRHDRVWIKPALETDDEKFIYDIFENGIFINRVELKLESSNFFFKNEYIYEIDYNNLVITKCTYN
ncbi:MAG: hypothetical protein JXR48_08205 [Candidatus Delongbacteria bacterium]|nr:hypothetical protein [Candidatus Delongbacteria bacterium]MBN2834936.1 hypothetical protein [Candidatus Delongbacteria bacterium]